MIELIIITGIAILAAAPTLIYYMAGLKKN